MEKNYYKRTLGGALEYAQDYNTGWGKKIEEAVAIFGADYKIPVSDDELPDENSDLLTGCYWWGRQIDKHNDPGAF